MYKEYEIHIDDILIIIKFIIACVFIYFFKSIFLSNPIILSLYISSFVFSIVVTYTSTRKMLKKVIKRMSEPTSGTPKEDLKYVSTKVDFLDILVMLTNSIYPIFNIYTAYKRVVSFENDGFIKAVEDNIKQGIQEVKEYDKNAD